MCLECLPQCDGCGLPLIPSNMKHGKQESGPSRYNSNKENNINLAANGEKASSPGAKDRGGESDPAADVAIDDVEDSDKEIVIEKDGLTQRYHIRCILKCACCRSVIEKKRGKLYKKQVIPPFSSNNSLFHSRILYFSYLLFPHLY